MMIPSLRLLTELMSKSKRFISEIILLVRIKNLRTVKLWEIFSRKVNGKAKRLTVRSTFWAAFRKFKWTSTPITRQQIMCKQTSCRQLPLKCMSTPTIENRWERSLRMLQYWTRSCLMWHSTLERPLARAILCRLKKYQPTKWIVKIARLTRPYKKVDSSAGLFNLLIHNWMILRSLVVSTQILLLKFLKNLSFTNRPTTL